MTAEEKAVQSKIAGDNSEEGESTTEVTTEKKEESTTATESQESQTSSERDTSSGNTEHSQTEHTTESTKRNTSGTSGNTDQAEDTSGNSSHSNEEGTTQKKAKKDISSREDAEIRTKAIKKITDQLAEEDAPDGSDKTSTFSRRFIMIPVRHICAKSKLHRLLCYINCNSVINLSHNSLSIIFQTHFKLMNK